MYSILWRTEMLYWCRSCMRLQDIIMIIVTFTIIDWIMNIKQMDDLNQYDIWWQDAYAAFCFLIQWHSPEKLGAPTLSGTKKYVTSEIYIHWSCRIFDYVTSPPDWTTQYHAWTILKVKTQSSSWPTRAHWLTRSWHVCLPFYVQYSCSIEC